MGTPVQLRKADASENREILEEHTREVQKRRKPSLAMARSSVVMADKSDFEAERDRKQSFGARQSGKGRKSVQYKGSIRGSLLMNTQASSGNRMSVTPTKGVSSTDMEFIELANDVTDIRESQARMQKEVAGMGEQLGGIKATLDTILLQLQQAPRHFGAPQHNRLQTTCTRAYKYNTNTNTNSPPHPDLPLHIFASLALYYPTHPPHPPPPPFPSPPPPTTH